MEGKEGGSMNGRGTFKGDIERILDSPESITTRIRAFASRLSSFLDGAAVSVRLYDAELGEFRLHNSGESMPTRTLINIMVEHDLYHAGEINYIRGLCRAHRSGEPSSWNRRPGTYP